MIFLFRKTILRVVIVIALLIALSVFLYFLNSKKKLELISPNGGETWRAGEKHEIVWDSKHIGKIAIVLVSGQESKEIKWIVKDYPAKEKRYQWDIFAWEKTGDEYRIGIFEYPWDIKKPSDYSDNYFKIIGPQFASCDALSIENQWPFIPSDYPGLRRVFITRESFNGDLGGLSGADKKCQELAEKQGLEGEWKAFLGDDENPAVERVKTEGIVVNALAAGTLPEGKTCHRLLGKNFDQFLSNFSLSFSEVSKKFGEDFAKRLSNVWLGRLTEKTKKECIKLAPKYLSKSAKDYSFTSTCQNWTTNKDLLPGYPKESYSSISFPKCYTLEGKKTEAVGLAGLASGLAGPEGGDQVFSPEIGRPCNIPHGLICIQQ